MKIILNILLIFSISIVHAQNYILNYSQIDSIADYGIGKGIAANSLGEYYVTGESMLTSLYNDQPLNIISGNKEDGIILSKFTEDGDMLWSVFEQKLSISSINRVNTNANGSGAGHVRVFENIAGTWTQIGNAIEGEAQWDRNGWSVALSADGTIVAMSAPRHNGNGPESGQVRVFENVQGTWTQVGTPLVGLQPNHRFGTSIALSADGSILAVGTIQEGSAGQALGYTMLFENIQGTWTQIGQPIYGTDPGNQSGRSVSLSSDGNIVAIGEPGYSTSSSSRIGNVRVFENISGTWTQIGSRIIGEAANDSSGISISLSSNGSIVGIGASGNDAAGNFSGHVRVYQNTSNTWSQVGIDIDGEDPSDYLGESVSISGSGDTLIVGATTPTTTATKIGYAKVYDLSGVLSSDKFTKANFTIYPNPATEVLNIELQDDAILENVTIYNNLGQKIKTIKQNTVDVSTLAKGLYFVEVTTNQGKASKKVIVE